MHLAKIIVCALMTFLVTNLGTQAADRTFVTVDYMRVPEDHSEQDYLALEKLWRDKVAKTGEARELVRREIWHNVLRTQPAKK